MSEIWSWVEFALKSTLVAFSIVWICDATKSIASQRWNNDSLLPGLLGAFVLLIHAFVGSWGAYKLPKLMEDLAPPAELAVIPQEAVLSFSSEERAEKTKMMAQINFQNHGVLTEHWLSDGTKIIFAPTEEEIEDRVSVARKFGAIEANTDQLRSAGYFYALLFLGAIGAGLFQVRIGRAKRSTSRREADDV